MKPNEITKLLAMAIAAYGYMQDKEPGAIAAVWRETLSDLSFDDARAALVRHISTNRFFPTVADIRDGAATISGSVSMMTADEGWRLVIQAARNAAYHAADEFERLPPEVQAALGSASALRELALVPESELGNERARFRMGWEARQHRAQHMAALPKGIRERLESVAASRALPALEAGRGR